MIHLSFERRLRGRLSSYPPGNVRTRLSTRRFLSTYTYGPLGVISRTAELDDDDVTNNRVHYYLPHAQGGHVGMLLDKCVAWPRSRGHVGGRKNMPTQAWAWHPFICGTSTLPGESQVGNGCHSQTYDAFGNAMSKTFTAAGSFAWRGAEGSVTDHEPNLAGACDIGRDATHEGRRYRLDRRAGGSPALTRGRLVGRS